MAYTHDPVRHLEYLRQSLSQDQKHIGFFLSAGCPLAVKSDPWPLIPDVKNLTQWINKELNKDKKYAALLEELTKANLDKENVEEILSFIRGLAQVAKGGTVRGFNEDELQKLENVVCEKIVQKMDIPLPGLDTPYHKLAKWISSIDREIPIEVFTTNYDLLMEQALDDLEVPYFDGFVGSRKSFFDLRAVEANLIPKHWTRLWKIHGSINWKQEKIKDQIKVYRSSEVSKTGCHLIYPSHLKYEQSRKMPYLALIDQLSRFISTKKSSCLIMSGYSFNDAHLNDTIINALKANPTAMVLALMFGEYLFENGGKDEERYPKAYELAKNQHNLSVWTFDKAIIGTNLGEWELTRNSEDPIIMEFIKKGTSKKTGKENTLLNLGNFDVFSEFLKSYIGIEKGFNNAK